MGMIVRDVLPEDRPAIRDALIECSAFSEEEVQVAMEMIDAGLENPYSLPAIEIEGRVRGYACIGKAPLSASAWYIYWICVHPAYQRQGVGRRLQERIEELVRL